jgi:selenium metabolism protein YedF
MFSKGETIVSMQIDARGQGCPRPVMMAEEALSKIKEGIVEVLVDNEESALNVAGFAAQNALFAETIKEGRDWRVKIAKGYSCEASAEARVRSAEFDKKKTLLLIIGTDIIGRDEELGKTLMQAFFETMKVYKQLPHTIFFLNTGVHLTTTNEEIAGLLQEVEKIGVEIYSCGTCLTKYNLESKLKVGRRGTMNIVVEGMQDFDKTVWV